MSVTTKFASVMTPFTHTENRDSTRRHFCGLFLLSSIGLVAGGRSAWAAERAVSIEDFVDSLNRIADGNPMLPGVQSLVGMKKEMADIAKGLSAQDMSILNGALYLEAQVQLRAAAARAPRRLTEAAIRKLLSRPIDTSRYGREFIVATIRNAKRRMATDPRYGAQLAEAGQAASRFRCKTLCQILVIGVLIGFALLLDHG